MDMDATQQIARLEERLAWLERHVTEQDKAMMYRKKQTGTALARSNYDSFAGHKSPVIH